MLFVDEVNLAAGVSGSSGFAEAFSRNGPRDSKGRSLRDLDLGRRLLRHRCSYMIYAQAFDSLPAPARQGVYARLWDILSGKENDKRYAQFSVAERAAIVDILRDTKKGLPDYFQPLTR
jgi:hypothetical protein